VLPHGHRRPDACTQAGQQVGLIQQALFVCALRPNF
jgi:hypothetical protein